MNEIFKLHDNEFDLWQSKFMSKIENEWKQLNIPVDSFQALLIHQSTWKTIVNDVRLENTVYRVMARSRYQRFIQKTILTVIEDANMSMIDAQQFILRFVNFDENTNC